MLASSLSSRVMALLTRDVGLANAVVAVLADLVDGTSAQTRATARAAHLCWWLRPGSRRRPTSMATRGRRRSEHLAMVAPDAAGRAGHNGDLPSSGFSQPAGGADRPPLIREDLAVDEYDSGRQQESAGRLGGR